MIERVVNFFTSLKLTVVCLAMSLVLVFIGTLAQVSEGLFLAQERYFQSLFVFWGPQSAGWKIPVWPGGYLLGGVLLLNLIAAHIKRFRVTRKKAGILLVHAGLILLFLGQFLTDLLAIESHMTLREGETKNYSESDRQSELVVIDKSQEDVDRVAAVPQSRLKSGEAIDLPELPFEVKVHQFFANSTNKPPQNAVPTELTTQGIGRTAQVFKMPLTVQMDLRNLPSAVVELTEDGESLGTWLVSTMLDGSESFTHEGKTYEIGLRWRRFYKPFSLELLKFSHDKYKGTEIPKNFSSRARLRNPTTQEDREVLIYMNNPLRYAGETYYQSGFREGQPITILQVVRNPSWLTPYVSCILVGLGLTVQFMMHLISFIKRRTA